MKELQGMAITATGHQQCPGGLAAATVRCTGSIKRGICLGHSADHTFFTLVLSMSIIMAGTTSLLLLIYIFKVQ